MKTMFLVWLKNTEQMKCDLKKIIHPMARGDESFFSSGSLQQYFGHNPKQSVFLFVFIVVGFFVWLGLLVFFVCVGLFIYFVLILSSIEIGSLYYRRTLKSKRSAWSIYNY